MCRQPWWPIKHQRAKPEFARFFFSFSSNMSRIVSCCHSRGTPCPNDPKAVKHRTNWSMMTLEAKMWNDTKWLINGSPIHRWQSDMNSEQEELITQRLKSAWLWLPCLYCVSLLVCSVLKLRIVSWMFALTTNTAHPPTPKKHEHQHKNNDHHHNPEVLGAIPSSAAGWCCGCCCCFCCF